MSKCYVIKNKDAKFWNTFCGFRDNISSARFFEKREYCINEMDFHRVLDRGFEIVECTICEGDLEKELEMYKNAFNQMSVEYAIAKGLTDVRDIQYAILDKAREEIEKEKKDET